MPKPNIANHKRVRATVRCFAEEQGAELTGCVFAGTLGVMLAFYFLRVRGRFRGPLRQAKSQEDLLLLEQELEK